MSSQKLFTDIVPPLDEKILEVLKELEFKTATPVQYYTIQHFLSHKDVNVTACTGSGKTLAFLIPVFQILNQPNCNISHSQVGGIIISPTRELANQTYTIAQTFEKHIDKVHTVLLTGGNEIADDMKQLKSDKGLLIIATPGRLKDIMERQGDKMLLQNFEVLVLDEADVLLDFGHAQAISAILSKLPKQRRTGLFSATKTDGVAALCKAGLRNPVNINIEIKNHNQIQAVPVLLKNYYQILPSDEKMGFLVEFLLQHKDEKTIVFFLTCASVDYFTRAVRSLPEMTNLPIRSLHGRMVQKKRTKTMEAFREPGPGILFCTDVAARGIDIPDIDWILQYSPPQDPAFFVHRVGRTARAGKKGNSLLLLEPTEDAYIPFTKKRGVPLVPYETAAKSWREKSLGYLKEIREKCATDREFYEESVTAFVADIRAYRNHDCNFILRFDALDLAAMARSFALVRLPKMSELKTRRIEFEEMDVDVASIPYKDPIREKARQERMKKEMEEREARKSAQKEREKQSVKRQKPEEKVEKKKKGKHEKMLNEWDELLEEERMYKLFKKNKISEEEYEKKLMSGGNNDDEEKTEKELFEKANKDHQMMRNQRKGKKTKAYKSKGSNK